MNLKRWKEVFSVLNRKTFLFFFIFSMNTLHAEDPIYSWEDEKGVIHFVDSEAMIPKKHKKAAKERAGSNKLIGDGSGGTYSVIPKNAPTDPAPDGLGTTNATPAESPQPLSENISQNNTTVPAKDEKSAKKDKTYWQGEINSWKQKKAQAEAEVKKLEGQMGVLYNTYGEGTAKMRGEIQQKQKEAERQLNEADSMLKNGIPDKARKEGVPPGWLR